MRRFLLLCLALPVILPAACLPVTGDRILGRDLARATPEFAALPALMQFGYTPAPGSTRVFPVTELQRIARANGIALQTPGEVCFEIPVHVPAQAELLEAMLRSLPSGAIARVVDMEHTALPSGRIDFPLSGLEPASTGSGGVQLWRGFVQYTDTRRVPVWARTAVAITYSAVVPRRDLPADTAIDAAALQIESRTGPPRRDVTAARMEEVAGRALRQPVKAGAEIPLSLLVESPAVRRGESVQVEIQSGHALLRFEAIAQSNARAGDVAEMRNPITGKTFRARILAGASPGEFKAFISVGGPAL